MRAITELTGDNVCTNIVYFDCGYKDFCVAMLDHNFWIKGQYKNWIVPE